MTFANRVGFTIGTGRCGTLFLYHVMEKEPDVASSHERNPENEAFQRYCQWHRLPVDTEGFLATKEREIRADLDHRLTGAPHSRQRREPRHHRHARPA